jgi:hypothetical protein
MGWTFRAMRLALHSKNLAFHPVQLPDSGLFSADVSISLHETLWVSCSPATAHKEQD